MEHFRDGKRIHPADAILMEFQSELKEPSAKPVKVDVYVRALNDFGGDHRAMRGNRALRQAGFVTEEEEKK